ncbi:MAG: hypothetical protein ACK5QT_09265 [Oligoflexia bacterium]|jgi:hypothetical protein
MASPLMQLLIQIEEEFRSTPGVRIRPVSPSTTQRAPDLEQNYDPESGTVHRVSGVRVQTRTREYFFPEDWVRHGHRADIETLIREIHEAIANDTIAKRTE